MFRCLTLLVTLLTASASQSQDLEYARLLVRTLSSELMDGRGYVNNGEGKAGDFIATEFGRMGLIPFGSSYFQRHSFPMNTFPGKVELSIKGKPLVPGEQFQVWAASPSIRGTYKVVPFRKNKILNDKRFNQFVNRDHRDRFIWIDKQGIEDKKVLRKLDSLRYTNISNAKGLIFVSDSKLSWSVMIGAEQRKYPVIDVQRHSFSGKPGKISLQVESKFISDFQSRNVLGYIPGEIQPDTFLVFTAHYDHLGRMGDRVYYPGANDNASGTAMVLDLARHYSLPENKPYYSMVFICLSGEEAGLHGANFCAAHSPFDLKKTKFLINLDMVGTGSEGITMVNGTQFKEAFDRMVRINADNEYLMTVKERGESCNSDHCPFYKKGVPAVFIYSMGKEYGEYHNPFDRGEKVPFTEYKDIFRLVRDFMDSAGKW